MSDLLNFRHELSGPSVLYDIGNNLEVFLRIMNNLQLPDGFSNPLYLEKKLKNQGESYWQEMGEKRALNLFRQMSARVPAYKDFLKKNRVDSQKVKSVQDFKHIPTVDKDNYLRMYPRESLCWDGQFKKNRWTISTTSGSTGSPYYFPRGLSQDWQYAISAELYLRTNFDVNRYSTLYVVAFPMGSWIGGVFTYEAIRLVAERGNYNLSVITPGINKDEILKAVKELGKSFDQIIIGSYAPFLKDILDDGEKMGIDWKSHRLGFVFSAEGFNETFRDYVIKKAGIENPLKGTLNHYGTVDLGTMAHETPLSVLVRRVAVDNPKIYKSLFSREDKLPTLAQYNPALFYFETEAGKLYCSAYSGLPLFRYDLKDSGGTISFAKIKQILREDIYDLGSAINKAKIKSTIWNLPFVYVYERYDFSVSFYAFLLYPEMIRKPLQREDLEEFVTGKFSMEVKYDKNGQQNLIINIELKAGQKNNVELRERTKALVLEALLKESSEYRETHGVYGTKIHPHIVFWPYEDPAYFKPGIKQQWVIKEKYNA